MKVRDKNFGIETPGETVYFKMVGRPLLINYMYMYTSVGGLTLLQYGLLEIIVWCRRRTH